MDEVLIFWTSQGKFHTVRLPPELDEGAKAESLRLSSNNADLEDKCLGWPVKGPDFELRVDKACNLISRMSKLDLTG